MNISRLAACLIAGTTLTVLAQTPVPPMPSAAPTPLQYRSAFEGYRPYVDADPIPWKRANDEAAAVGGPLGQMAKDGVPTAKARPGTATAVPAKPAAAPAGSTGQPR